MRAGGIVRVVDVAQPAKAMARAMLAKGTKKKRDDVTGTPDTSESRRVPEVRSRR
ncbi:hypothetical protein ASA1KI_37140 [Opitutales bacterium ASA1]|nr:hypothetical protein ASA1KI_37140 [Opitutales bacterium ASA1]